MDKGEHLHDEGSFYASGVAGSHPTPESEGTGFEVRQMLLKAAKEHGLGHPVNPSQKELSDLVNVAYDGGDPWDVHGGDKQKAREALMNSSLMNHMKAKMDNWASKPDTTLAHDLVRFGLMSHDYAKSALGASTAAARSRRFDQYGHLNFYEPNPNEEAVKHWKGLEDRHDQASEEFRNLEPSAARAKEAWRKKYGHPHFEAFRDATHRDFGKNLEEEKLQLFDDYHNKHVDHLLGAEDPDEDSLREAKGGVFGDHRKYDEDGKFSPDNLQWKLWNGINDTQEKRDAAKAAIDAETNDDGLPPDMFAKRQAKRKEAIDAEHYDRGTKLSDFWNAHTDALGEIEKEHGQENNPLDIEEYGSAHRDDRSKGLKAYSEMLNDLIRSSWDHHKPDHGGYYPSTALALSRGTGRDPIGERDEDSVRKKIAGYKEDQLGHVLPVVKEHLNNLGSAATDEDVKKLFDAHTDLYMADRARHQAAVVSDASRRWYEGRPLESTVGHGYYRNWAQEASKVQQEVGDAGEEWDKAEKTRSHGGERAAKKVHKAQDDLLFHDIATGKTPWTKNLPRMYYHGTPGGRHDEPYDRDSYSKHAAENQRLGPGMYHTADYRIATKGYTQAGTSAHNSDGATDNPYVYANVVNTKKLFDADKQLTGDDHLEHMAHLTAHATHLQTHGVHPDEATRAASVPKWKAHISSKITSRAGYPTSKDWYDHMHMNQGVSKVNLNATLAAHGYDGVTHLDRYRPNVNDWGDTSAGHRVVIPFDTKNVKSIHGNSGEFHPDTKNIFKSLSLLILTPLSQQAGG
jgi:hypothetical protein